MSESKSSNNIERRFSLELRADESKSDSRTLTGYAAVFNRWSEDLGWFKEIIHPGAFANAIKVSDVRALFNHDPNHLLARTKSGTLELWEDDQGLGFRFELPEHRHDLYEMVKRGDLSQNSFAFTIKTQEWVERDDEIAERHIKELARLYDVSPVTYPAYPDTSLALRSFQLFKGTEDDLDLSGVGNHKSDEVSEPYSRNDDGSWVINIPTEYNCKKEQIERFLEELQSQDPENNNEPSFNQKYNERKRALRLRQARLSTIEP